jgi:hypothetical protein
MKNIIIYTHMHHFDFKDGGTVVQYLLAKTLEEFGQNVRIYATSGIKINNSIFNKFYNNDFLIDDNCVVIYCEGTQGNPLGAQYVVRWMLSKLGQNELYEYVNNWGKNELVYYFNSEEKIANNLDKLGNIYKMLTVFYVNPEAKNNNLGLRTGTCFTIRKSENIRNKIANMVHHPSSFQITRNHTQLECIKIFNTHKYFVSYDSITFLSVISALCGCISFIVKVDGLSKEDWLKTFPTYEYLKESGETMLYGIAYGQEEIDNAINTIHLAKDQWDRILKFSKDKYISSFINDINDWNNNINTIESNFFS